MLQAPQPAPHFSGRAALVSRLSTWVDDTASPDRILVAAGGTGKTAIVEQVLRGLQQRWPRPGAGQVLVWSFYEKPDADAFLRECGQLLLGEPDDAPPGGQLERLQRGLRDNAAQALHEGGHAHALALRRRAAFGLLMLAQVGLQLGQRGLKSPASSASVTSG